MSGEWLSARLPVLDLAVASVDAVQRAAARAAGGPYVGSVDPERVAAAFASDLLVDGVRVEGFAPLSGFFQTAEGWVRTHANYPHHRERLLRMLGLADDTDRAALADRLALESAQDVEDNAADVGAIAVRVRDETEWRASHMAHAIDASLQLRRRGSASDPVDSPVRTRARDDAVAGRWTLPRGDLPLRGVRVLDLTRVIAGPVATRTLALFGADVLRVDSPALPEIGWQHFDTGQGKRTALLDLSTTDGFARVQALLDAADVLVTGYRPGAIESFGLRLPAGAIHARITAWSDAGPWAERRGFDSIVQAATGIAMIESTDGSTPGALPVQALDHATGYLLAAAVIDALVDRSEDGRGRDIEGALARTAQVLLDAPGRVSGAVPPAAVPSSNCAVTHSIVIDGTLRDVTTARPAFASIADYSAPAHPWGTDDARWAGN